MSALPIDARKPIGRDKYLDEDPLERLFNFWFVFGESADSVDIVDTSGDVLTHVPRDKAPRILEARDQFLSVMKQELV